MSLSLCVLVLIPAAALGQADTALWPPEIAKIVRDLGHASFAQREEAMQLLWSRGESAELAVRAAQRSQDPEVARRARHILDKYRGGNYPDTPAEILLLLRGYSSLDTTAKSAALQKLLAEGSAGFRTLGRLLGHEEVRERLNLWRTLEKQVGNLIPTLLETGKEAELEELLATRLSCGGDAARADYAIFLVQTGRLSAAEERWRTLLVQYGDPQAAAVLTFLYRARGDLTRARAAAERAQDLPLLHLILHEQGAWQELSAQHERFLELRNNLGLRAAYHHLAQDEDRLRPLLASLPAGILLQLARPEQALAKEDDETLVRFLDRLAERGEYGRLFQVLEKAKPATATLELYRARRLVDVGEKEIAESILARLQKLTGEAAPDPLDILAVKKRLRTRGQILPEYARAIEQLLHPPAPKAAVKVEMKAAKDGTDPDAALLNVLWQLYPHSGWEGLGWWRVYRRLESKEGALATLQRIEGLLAGKASRAEVERAFAAVQTLADDPAAANFLTPLAARAEALGRADLARQCLELATRSGDAAAWQGRGDAYLRGELWDKAADCYRRARDRDALDAASCFLQGWALTRQGQDKEGQRLTELAYRLPLADAGRRLVLAEALERVGLTDTAQRQRELLVRTSLRDWSTGQTWRELSRAAAAKKDFRRSAAAYEQFVLGSLWRQSTYLENEAPLWVGQHLHFLRARAQLEASDINATVREVRRALDLYPGDVDTLLRFYPALLQRGRGKDAEELYVRCVRLHAAVCLEFPSRASSHNQLAWLAARCGRDLDKALTHARQAIELEPTAAGYRDTLAEVHFQRGEKDQALAASAECLRLAPDNSYYRRQRERMTAGDPRAALPE